MTIKIYRSAFQILLLLCVLPFTIAQPDYLPTTEVAVENLVDRPKIIVPGLEIYGVPWTSDIEEFKLELGLPNGVLHFRGDSVALIYGKTHALIFEDDLLREVIISRSLISHVLSEHMITNPYFDGEDWEISPGIHPWTSPEEVSSALPKGSLTMNTKNTKGTYLTDYASVTLAFARSFERGSPPDGFRRLINVNIRGQ